MKRIAFTITEYPGVTKIQSLLNSVTEAIGSGKLAQDEQLPSINELSARSGFSRDTVVKVYHLLKQRSLIESIPAKGFFVRGGSLRIFMLLDDFSTFKEQLYHSFRNNLPKTWTVDLLFQNYNEKVFKQLVRNSTSRYSMYVVMNLTNKKLHPALLAIDPKRLLVLDMGSSERAETNFLLQDFDEAAENCLKNGIDLLKKYEEVIMIYSQKKTPHPPETESAVRRFCDKNGFHFKVYPEFNAELIRSGQAYLVIKESDLVTVVKTCMERSLVLGRDVGVLSYNDTPMKEIAGNGITTMSVDFGEMGKKAALFVRNRQKIREFLPTSLIIRQSL